MTSNLKVNNILPSTGTTVAVSGIASVTSSVSIASSCTATTFYGSGANLTNLPTQVTITGNADDRVITGGSGVNLNGESNMTYTSNLLKLATGSSTSTDAELLHLVGGGTSNRGLKISTGRASGANQNHAAAIYDAINSESNGYGSQHRFKIAGTDCFTIGYNGDFGYVGINDNVPYPDAVSGNTVNTCLELGSPSGTDTASVIKFNGRDGNNNLNKCQMQWAGANNRFDITVNGNPALQIQPNKDVEVTDGNLLIGTSGHGISFAADANTGGMTGELLDDYETGTWTPDMVGSSGSDSWNYRRAGKYTKIGNKVTASWSLGQYDGNLSGDVFISNLPFTIDFRQYGGDIGLYDVNTPSGTIIGYFVYLDGSTTNVRLYWSRSGQQGVHMNSGHLIGGNRTFYEGNVTYYTNS